MTEVYKIGDEVRASREIKLNDHLTIAPGTAGVVTAGALGLNVEVKWYGLDRLSVVNTDFIYLFDDHEPEPGDDFHRNPEPEAPPAMGWFAALAEQNVVASENTAPAPVKDRYIARAQVYAELEKAAAIDRLALAVDQAVRRG